MKGEMDLYQAAGEVWAVHWDRQENLKTFCQ